jgi:hypothetical protein
MTELLTDRKNPKTVEELKQALDSLILAGQIMEAYETFYGGNVEMRKNTNEPVRGREANRERLAAVPGAGAGIHSVRLLGGASSGDRTCSGWEYDMTFKDGVPVQTGRGRRAAIGTRSNGARFGFTGSL